MRDFLKLLKIFKIDTLSKFNINIINNINNSLQFFLLIDLKLFDNKFLSNFLYISKVVFFWFDQKIVIVRCFNDRKIENYKNKNTLIVVLGLLFRHKIKIVKSLWYIFNILQKISKTIDSNFNFKMNLFYFNYYFNNINYLLGLPDYGKFFVWKHNINIIVYLQKNLSKPANKFYEKLFY